MIAMQPLAAVRSPMRHFTVVDDYKNYAAERGSRFGPHLMSGERRPSVQETVDTKVGHYACC